MALSLTRNARFWWAAALGLGLDQLSKAWVVQQFRLQESWSLLPGIFHLTYVRNPGAAFSLFSHDGSWLRWLSLAVSLALIALGLFGPRLPRWEQLGYGLILAGAIGNGIDRFLQGTVVDFLDLRLIRFPVFNIADVLINLGLVCLVVAAWDQSRGDRPRP